MNLPGRKAKRAGGACACLIGLAFVFLTWSGAASFGAEDGALVAAAADLRFALGEVADTFRAAGSEPVRLIFGSSGNFAQQIRHGAPFEVYLSADEEYALALARDGFARDEGVLYAIGRIVIIAPHGSPLRPDGSLSGLRSGLSSGLVKRFAIANPEHAPYGRRAEEALRHEGLWDAIKDKLVYGENVSQAAQFALTNNAQGGIIAYSLALSPEVSRQGQFELVPAEWHEPLRQRMVLLKHARAQAQRFYEFMQQPIARAILRRYGFVLPGEVQ